MTDASKYLNEPDPVPELKNCCGNLCDKAQLKKEVENLELALSFMTEQRNFWQNRTTKNENLAADLVTYLCNSLQPVDRMVRASEIKRELIKIVDGITQKLEEAIK